MSWRGRVLVMVAVVSFASGLDMQSVPSTSYIDLRFGDKPEETAPTPTPTPTETHGAAGPDRSGVPGTSYIDRDKGTTEPAPGTTEGEEATTIVNWPTGPTVKEPEKSNADLTGTSYIDKNTVNMSSNSTESEKTNATVTVTGPPVKAPNTTETIDFDRFGVPGTSYIDQAKHTMVSRDTRPTEVEKTSMTVKPTSSSLKVPASAETVYVNSTGVPETAYIDLEKDAVKPDSNKTADIVSPMFTDHNENIHEHLDKKPSEFVSKADEFHSNKEKVGSTASKKKVTSGKLGEIRKEVKGVQGDKIKTTKSKRSITETNKRKMKKSNHELLNHLGLRKLKMPTVNHHRKRLASQSRKAHRQTSSADSKMFVIKLPPEPYYYAHHDFIEAKKKPVNTLPVSFSSNGKPSRVYHWNLPVMKKMVARKAGSPKLAVFADSDVFNIDKQATWNDSGDEKPHHTKTAFYTPKKASKEAFRKYFSGNGKPHSFYVMSKNKTPISTYRLLP